ncbi:MAG: hypothetical protein PUK14_00880 [Clostridiales bacterium]|nr:hypothetical protein [Clostridiales bacterium]
MKKSTKYWRFTEGYKMQISKNSMVKIILIILAIAILFCATSCGNDSKKSKKVNIEITVTEDEHWTETSTPAIVQVKGKSKTGEKVNFYHAINYDKTKSKIKLDEGKYEVNAITPINSDGSLYEVSKDYDQSDKECEIELEYVASKHVPDEQFEKAKAEIEKALKKGDKSLDEKTVKNIRKNLKTAKSNRDKLKNEKQNSEKLKQESMAAYKQFIVAAESGPDGRPLEGYYLIDFADRGVYDLVAKYGDCEAAYVHRVFRYNGKTIEALGDLGGGHSGFAKGKDGRPYIVWGHMGGYNISRINKDLSAEVVSDYAPTDSDNMPEGADAFYEKFDQEMEKLFGGNGLEVYYKYYKVDDLSPFN